MSIEPLDHTADVGFDLEAGSLEELFASAAVAFTGTITDAAALRAAESRSVRLAADDRELLLVEWLEELLYLLDAESMLFGRAEVTVDEGEGTVMLEATLHGEPFDPERHEQKVAVKGITYHGLEVRRDGERWRARVILDI